MSEYKDGRGDYYLAAGMTDQPVPAATDWRTLVCGVCGWSMQTQSPYDLVISHGNMTHRMSVRAAPAPTAPAGLRVEGSCGCNCRCHTDEGKPIWPGPCEACCEPLMNCDCGRALAAIASPSEEPGLDVERLARALPDALSLASEQDMTYEYSEEPGSPYVRFLAEALAAGLAKEPG